MSLKCSLLGHNFGDPEIERDREEQGSEVVITITETESCGRCGKTRIVSENKEVTTLETPSDIVGDDLEDQSATTEPDTDPTREEQPATAGGAAEPATEPSGDTASAVQSVSGADETADDSGPGAVVETDPETDDGIILEDDDEEDERPPGEWPDAEADDSEDADDDQDWEPPTDQPDGRPVEDEQPDDSTNAVTVPEGVFHCPECGFERPVESSSLREGDFCPECHRGALTHRPDEQ